MITAGVIFFCGCDATFWTGINTKVAFLTKLFINCYVTFQNQSPNIVLIRLSMHFQRKLSCALQQESQVFSVEKILVNEKDTGQSLLI
jgi:hypothetical protein